MVCLDIDPYTPANMYVAGIRVVRASDNTTVKGIIGTTIETSIATAIAGEQVKAQITIENNGQIGGSGNVNITAGSVLNQNIAFTVEALSSVVVTSNNFAQPTGKYSVCAVLL